MDTIGFLNCLRVAVSVGQTRMKMFMRGLHEVFLVCMEWAETFLLT